MRTARSSSSGVCGGGLPPTPRMQTPPPTVNRMTHTCKNITLPQTSFADGKKRETREKVFGGLGGRGAIHVIASANTLLSQWSHEPAHVEFHNKQLENWTIGRLPLFGLVTCTSE